MIARVSRCRGEGLNVRLGGRVEEMGIVGWDAGFWNGVQGIGSRFWWVGVGSGGNLSGI